MLTETLLPWPDGKAPDPACVAESRRAQILELYGLDALEDDPELVQITRFVAQLCNAPICLVSLVEEERQRFLAREGLEEHETPRPTSFCAHAMMEPEPMVVTDAKDDPRFETNPLVTGHPHIRFYAGAPLISHEGAPLGSLCVIDTEPRPEGLTPLQRQGMKVMAASVMRRLRQRREALSQSRAVERSEKELRIFADSIPDIAWSSGPDGDFKFVNARFREWTGKEPPHMISDWESVIHPDDWKRTIAKFDEAVEAGELFEDEWRIVMANGTYRWVSSRAVPVGNNGAGANWYGTVTDIDAVRRESENRDLLARELSHRIKNIFAVVSGLISIRSRGEPELQKFAQELTGAIKSLNKAHDYVNPVEGRKGNSLRDLLTDLLAPYGESDKPHIVVTGEEDDLPISAAAATPFALIFHELATNSAKYGALSEPGGMVKVHIGRADAGALDAVGGSVDTDARPIRILWSEAGVAPERSEDNPREGFGSRLLRMSVESQLRGQMTRVFDKEGLEVELIIPASAISGG